MENNNNDDLGEQLAESAINNSNSKSITRSVHINTRYVTITITTQAESEDIEMIRKMAEEIVDKYKE